MHRADFHLHSHLSPDASGRMEEILNYAIKKGIKEIAITDHYDLMSDLDNMTWRFRTAEYFAEIGQLRAEHEGRIHLRAGVELGQPHLHPAYAKRFVEANGFDFVLGSLHNFSGDQEAHLLPLSRYRDYKALFTKYFAELLEMVDCGGFDCLAHITYPERYVYMNTGLRINFREFERELSPVLSRMIKRGIGLEVNTAGMRRDIKKLSADRYILSLYKKLGGKIVTIGSDAHLPREVGAGFDDAIAALRSAGFSEYATFENREARFWSI